MKLSIAIKNDMLCGTVFFSLLKKFIQKLENLCMEAGVCSVANIELGEAEEDGRILKLARFDVRMSDDSLIRIAASARTLEDAISNAFDDCERNLSGLRRQETRA
ncbi:MAG: hypothetical protein JO301_01175 [Chitinophagaceae bacterium]|nr:hypothetical protein [Chitinophagaceae bacterium]